MIDNLFSRARMGHLFFDRKRQARADALGSDLQQLANYLERRAREDRAPRKHNTFGGER